MTGITMSPVSVPMMAVMMLPSAVPALARRAREPGGALAAPWFAASYAGVWTLAGVGVYLLYRPPSPVAAGALLVGAGVYELTPLKRECRRRCRERVSSGLQFGAYCMGSSAGLMVALVAVDVMSVVLMAGVATVVLVQKLSPPHRWADVPLALAIVTLGLITAL
jgi:predicted metal-binding membrane protein